MSMAHGLQRSEDPCISESSKVQEFAAAVKRENRQDSERLLEELSTFVEQNDGLEITLTGRRIWRLEVAPNKKNVLIEKFGTMFNIEPIEPIYKF